MVEVGAGVGEGGAAEFEEAVQVPVADVLDLGVDVDGVVEEVGDGQTPGGRGLEDVDALDDEDVGAVHGLTLVGDDVVVQVGVDGDVHPVGAGLHLRDEADQGPPVVALGKALAAHEAARLQDRVGVQEVVGADQLDVGVVGPLGQQ